MKNILLGQLASFKDSIEEHQFYKDDSSIEAAGMFWHFLTVIFQLMHEDLLKLELQEVRNAERFIRKNFEVFITRLNQWMVNFDLVDIVKSTDWTDEDSVYDTTWTRHMYQGVMERIMIFLEDESDWGDHAGNDKNYELLFTCNMRRKALDADCLVLFDRNKVRLMQNQGFEVCQYLQEDFWWCSKSADNVPDVINGIPGCWLPEYFTCWAMAAHLDGALTGEVKTACEKHLAECRACKFLHDQVNDDLVQYTKKD